MTERESSKLCIKIADWIASVADELISGLSEWQSECDESRVALSDLSKYGRLSSQTDLKAVNDGRLQLRIRKRPMAYLVLINTNCALIPSCVLRSYTPLARQRAWVFVGLIVGDRQGNRQAQTCPLNTLDTHSKTTEKSDERQSGKASKARAEGQRESALSCRI